MKRIVIFVAAILFAATIQTQLFAQEQLTLPENPCNHRIICFGNRSQMSYTDFMIAKDTSAILHAVDSIYSFEYVDPDNCPSEYIAYKEFDWDYPILAVVDEDGNIYGVVYGSLSDKEIVQAIIQSDSIKKPLSLSELVKQYKRECTRRSLRSYIDFSAGYLNSWYSGGKPFSGSGSDGFTVELCYRKGVAKRISILSGLNFDLYGGRVNEKIIKEPTLRIPVAAEVTCATIPIFFRSCPGGQKLLFRAGVWGGYGLKDNEFGIRRWNGGYSLEVGLKAGSFDLHIGYDRGIIDRVASCNPYSSLYTNALKIGFRLRIGE